MLDFRYLLWNNHGTSDKVWGVFNSEDGPITFWGRRGAKLTFKHDVRNLYELKDSKERRGYNRQDPEAFNTRCTQDGIDFLGKLQRDYIKAKLAGHFHREEVTPPIDIGPVS